VNKAATAPVLDAGRGALAPDRPASEAPAPSPRPAQETRLDVLEKEVCRQARLIEQMQLVLEDYAMLLDKLVSVLEHAALLRGPSDLPGQVLEGRRRRNRKIH